MPYPHPPRSSMDRQCPAPQWAARQALCTEPELWAAHLLLCWPVRCRKAFRVALRSSLIFSCREKPVRHRAGRAAGQSRPWKAACLLLRWRL